MERFHEGSRLGDVPPVWFRRPEHPAELATFERVASYTLDQASSSKTKRSLLQILNRSSQAWASEEAVLHHGR